MNYLSWWSSICLFFFVASGTSSLEAFSQEQSHFSAQTLATPPESAEISAKPLSPRTEKAILAMLDILENNEDDFWKDWAAGSLCTTSGYPLFATTVKYTTENDEIAERTIRILQNSNEPSHKFALCWLLTTYHGKNVDIFTPLLHFCLQDEGDSPDVIVKRWEALLAVIERADHRQCEIIAFAVCRKIQNTSVVPMVKAKMIQVLDAVGIADDQVIQTLRNGLDDRRYFSCWWAGLIEAPLYRYPSRSMMAGFPAGRCTIASMCAKTLADLQVKNDDIYAQIQSVLDRKELTSIDQSILHCSLVLLRPTEENLDNLKKIYQRDFSASLDAEGRNDYSDLFVDGVVHETLRKIGHKAKSFVPLINADIRFCEELNKNNDSLGSFGPPPVSNSRIEFLQETLRAIDSP